MLPKDIAALRLFNQQISSPAFLQVSDILQHMGAMQAQDFQSAVWAVGLRHKNSAISEFEKSYNSGEILRTHVMRPTWHLVANKNINWLLDLTASQVLSQTKGRHRDLGLSTQLLHQCNAVFENELSGGLHMTREEILAALKKHKLLIANQQLSHILMNAELHKILCSGSLKDKKLTYALFEERVTDKTKLAPDEALAELAKIYFTSHGPALAEDFQWWSGLSAGKVKLGIAAIEKTLTSLMVDGKKFYFFEPSGFRRPEKDSIYLLPAYDEFIISYRDRSTILNEQTHGNVVSSNGIFRPVIVDNNAGVVGIWRHLAKNNSRSIELQFFKKSSQANIKRFEKKLMHYGEFLGQKVILIK